MSGPKDKFIGQSQPLEGLANRAEFRFSRIAVLREAADHANLFGGISRTRRCDIGRGFYYVLDNGLWPASSLSWVTEAARSAGA
jgi:hypothetical protein